MSSIVAIIGLGNPGKKYEETRHNLGFNVVDKIITKETSSWQKGQARYKASSFFRNSRKIWCVKPQTYMNTSGRPIKNFIEYYKVSPSETLVIVDDVELALGTLRIRKAGSSGGHNGLKSIIDQLSTGGFPRLRLGIGRPENKVPLEQYVLSNFSEEEKKIKEKMVDNAVQAINCILNCGITIAMNEFN